MFYSLNEIIVPFLLYPFSYFLFQSTFGIRGSWQEMLGNQYTIAQYSYFLAAALLHKCEIPSVIAL